MPKQVTVNLFGARGQRSVEITTRGGFPARHVRIGTPTETPPLSITPDLPAEEQQTKKFLTLDILADILAKMEDYNRDNGYKDTFLGFSEIVKVTCINLKYDLCSLQLLEMLRELYKQGQIEHRVNRFKQDTFRLIPEKEKPRC